MSSLSRSLALIVTCLALSAAAQKPAYYDNVQVAHASLGSVAWIIFFPLGAVLLRLLTGPNTVWIHAGVQLFALSLVVVNSGTGIWMSLQPGKNISDYHPVIGLVIFSLVFIHPISGLLHHGSMRKHGRRTVVSYVHIWIGRALITLGIINGGLGLMYSGDDTTGETIAYSIIAAAAWITYVAIAFTHEVKPRAAIPKAAMQENIEVFQEIGKE